MQVIPSLVLKQLYTFGSLQNNEHRVTFAVKNRLSDATLTAVSRVKLDGRDIPLSAVTLILDDGTELTSDQLSDLSVDFPLRRTMKVTCAIHFSPPRGLGTINPLLSSRKPPAGSPC